MHENFIFMHDNEISMQENEIPIHKNEKFIHKNDEKFAQKVFMGENPMREVVYRQTTHENFIGEKTMPGERFPFLCMKRFIRQLPWHLYWCYK